MYDGNSWDIAQISIHALRKESDYRAVFAIMSA